MSDSITFTGHISGDTSDKSIVTFDVQGEAVVVSIASMARTMRCTLSTVQFSRLLGWRPYEQRFRRKLTLVQESNLVAALRFYQAHGGPLDPGVQEYLDREDMAALTPDEIDELADMLYTGKVVVYPWIDGSSAPSLPPFAPVAPAMYVQVVVGGVTPILIGPFDTDDDRDAAARQAFAEHGPAATILWLNDDNGALTTGAYNEADMEG